MTGSSEGAGATASLVDLATSVRLGELPEATVAAAKTLVLDMLICAVAGAGEGSGAIVTGVLSAAGGKPEATLLGGGGKVPALTAASVNAHAANVLDADDTVRYKGHVGAAAVPTALAFAERQNSSGRAFLEAVIAGYEVATRIGLSLKAIVVGPSGGTEFAPVTGYSWVGFASTVAAGRLLGLDAGRLRQAFGITGASLPLPGSTPFGTSLPRPMTKYAMYGTIAQASATAALLAEAGFTGEPHTLDGDKGLWRALGSLDCDPHWMLERPDGHWMVEDACIKPYPACRFNNPAIDLFYELTGANGIPAGDIEAIEVLVPPAGLTKHRAGLRDPESLVDACFSLPHLLGCAAYAGRPGMTWLREETRLDPRVRALADKVTCGPEPRAGAMATEDIAARGHMARMPTTVTITAGGRSYRAEAEYARGDVFDPATRFGPEDMARKLADFCGHLLTERQQKELVAVVDDLENQPDVSALLPNLVTAR